MRSFIAPFLVASAAVFFAPALAADGEFNLFDIEARATAYIAVDDEQTIYLWDGKPVAYLDHGDAGELDVFGFNGKHLGWFIDGVLRDHDGNVACVVKRHLQRNVVEPPKPFRRQKPFQNFKEFAPAIPDFSKSWAETPCQSLLMRGVR